jgi:hypothetical protein
VSVIVPAYNEADVVVDSLTRICEEMRRLEDRFRWEVILVDDGSTDGTATLAEGFAAAHPRVRVLRHRVNFRLGQALRYAFGATDADYLVVLDCDLSYDPAHIGRMLATMIETGARIVIASPYLPGGRVTKVPWARRVMSRVANRLLALSAGSGLTTFTGMVRAYDGPFLRSLDLRSVDAEINTEIIHKAQVLRARIVEIPAHLDWTFATTGGRRRPSPNVRVTRSTFSALLSSFLFRPFVFFTLPGLVLLAAAVIGAAACVHNIVDAWRLGDPGGATALAAAVAVAYRDAPHTFLLTGVLAVLGVQLVAFGVLAAQQKRYFEDLFHLGTTLLRRSPAPPRAPGRPAELPEEGEPGAAQG